MRRSALSLLSIGLLASCVASLAPAHAAGKPPTSKKPKPPAWRTFSSTSLGVSFRYPGTWRVSSLGKSATSQITVAGAPTQSMLIGTVPLRPTASPDQMVKNFVSYQQKSTHSKIWGNVRWSPATLGGYPARAGVNRPSTEGGVRVADAIYLVQARGRTYELILFSYHKPPYSKIGQFPKIYFQILGSWHFL